MGVAVRVALVLPLLTILACAWFGLAPYTGVSTQPVRSTLTASVPTHPTVGHLRIGAPSKDGVHTVPGVLDRVSTVERDEEDVVDLYGNEVTDAVAKYKLDATGSLYELHSPQTEVPRLPSPRS